MTTVIHKIFVGAGGKHTLSPEESLRGSVSFGKLHVRPQNIMHALCAEIRLDYFKFASYGPVLVSWYLLFPFKLQHTNKQTNKKQTNKQKKDKNLNKQTDKHTNKQANKQANKQTTANWWLS